MTVGCFTSLIHDTAFFKNVGNATYCGDVVNLSSLSPWGDRDEASVDDISVADEMGWLPTSRDQIDPFYPSSLDAEAASEDDLNMARKCRTEVHKIVLKKLRHCDEPLFKVGANNLTESAKAAASYALRNAVTEVVFGIDGEWRKIAKFYFEGNWPCGLTPAGKIVVI